MEFGSEYTYIYEQPDFEYISDDEYEFGMNISNSEESDSDDENDTYEEIPPPPVIPSEEPGGPPGEPRGPLQHVPPPPPPKPTIFSDSAALRARSLDSPPTRPKRHQKKKVLKTHWRSAEQGGRREANKDSSPSHNKHHRRVRQGDTNIVTVKFDKLISPSKMHAGDPQSCSQCGAILSALSELKQEEDTKVWCCEFCDTRNILDIEDEEKPNDSDVTFMLEPALSTSASGPTGLDESLVVFCVDVSGSMCVTTEVPGHVELRGAQGLRRAQLLNRERTDQYLPRQSRNVTYVSRLQSVQAAIDHQLQEMTKDFPNRRVALITFSNEVTVYGDGKTDPLAIAGDKLGNKDTLKTIATEQPFPDSIKNTRQQLGQKLFELEEFGPTALGPALLIASTMAGKVRGSKVILCTDGLANVGMGKLDNFKSDDEKDESSKFYDEISEAAVENGVSISVVTIKGTDCKLVEIGKMADKTGGQVNIVDPLKLTQEFSTILANKIMATNVIATFILHKELFFFYEDTEESKVVKNVGNVTAESEISFEYGVRTKPAEQKKESPGVPDKIMEVDETEEEEQNKMDTDEPSDKVNDKQMNTESQPDAAKTEEPKVMPGSSGSTESQGAEGTSEGSSGENTSRLLPFQLQIVYNDTEGAKALRVITQHQPVTRERKVAESKAKLDVLATHTAITTSRMALDGMYTMGRERALMNQRVAWRHTRATEDVSSRPVYKSKFGKIKKMENYLNTRQQSERASSGRTYSDDESDDEDAAVSKAEARPPGPLKTVVGKGKSFFSRLKKKRSESTDDAGAVLVMKGKHAKSFFEESDSD